MAADGERRLSREEIECMTTIGCSPARSMGFRDETCSRIVDQLALRRRLSRRFCLSLRMGDPNIGVSRTRLKMAKEEKISSRSIFPAVPRRRFVVYRWSSR